MDFLEKDLEDIMVEYHRKLKVRGFEDFYEHIERQFYLPSGKKIDIITWEIKGDVLYAKIIELKKDSTNEAALFQGLGYMQEFCECTAEEFSDLKVDLILVGTNIYNSVSNFLSVNPKNLKLYEYEYSFDGIKFRLHDYSVELMIKWINDRRLNNDFSVHYAPGVVFSNSLRDKDNTRQKELI